MQLQDFYTLGRLLSQFDDLENLMTKEEMICRILRYVTQKPSAQKTCCG